MKRFKTVLAAIAVSAGIFSMGGNTQAASYYSTTETYYGSGYYCPDSTYNMQMQLNFGGTGDEFNTYIQGYTSVLASSSDSSNVVSISSNAFASADDAIHKINGIGGYGNGGPNSVSISYRTTDTAYATRSTHTNHVSCRKHEVILFYTKQ